MLAPMPLEMRTNGIQHDISNTNHLREKGGEEGRGLKEYIIEGKKLNPKPNDCIRLAYVHMLTPGKLCLSSMCPRSICVHAKEKIRNQQTSKGRKKCREHRKGHKADRHDRHGKHRNKDASKQVRRQTSKKAKKQAKGK